VAKGTNLTFIPFMGMKKHLIKLDRYRKVIEMFIDEADPYWGVNAISVVGNPAIQKNFIAFSKDAGKNEIKLMNEEQRIIVGPVLIPDMKITRSSEADGEYEIFFSADTVRKVAHLYLKRNNQSNTTVQHEGGIIEGCTVVESWIVESKMDKSVHLGYQLPSGTWMAAMKVEDDSIWNKVKSGELKGYSIEGMFTELEGLTDNEDTVLQTAMKAIKEFISN